MTDHRSATDGNSATEGTGWDGTNAQVGDVVAGRTLNLTRDALVRYAGASGDFNPIHYRDDVAAAVGLPGVLAHGMLTMGAAMQTVVDALGDPARVRSCQSRFTKPVVVDPEHGAEVTIEVKVGQVPQAADAASVPDAAGDDAQVGRLDLTVTFEGKTVLGKAQVFADFAPGPAAPGTPTGEAAAA